MGYWINRDVDWDTLHQDNCAHALKWAREPKWRRFDTQEEARRSTSESRLRECEGCIG